MPASALALALAAAFVHALWNMLLARARDSQAATAVALAIGVVLFAPAAALTWHVSSAAIPFVIASSALEILYFVFLAAAYQAGELSLVYPVARGTAPVIVLPLSAIALGTGVDALQVAGVVAIGSGVLLVRGPRGAVPRRDLLLALAVGACVAGYTVVDKAGLRHAGPLPYLELVLILPAIVYFAIAARLRGRTALANEIRPATLLAAVGMPGAFALALAALRLASPAPVAAVRETSVVFAALLGALVLHEPLRRGRLGGAALIAGGIAVLALA
jgi:drug/metabolite transporter (DMT)-like permease